MAATRRLAAVMFTDIVGYSSLTQSDEEGALRLLQEQEELVRPLVSTYHGREVKSTGDGYLIEFESARDATKCAVEIQERLHERNSRAGVVPLPVRIGIHLGDVEQRGSDIFGDAVNIAARIEPAAEPGGVCVSGQVFDQIRNKLPFKLEKLEHRALKGIRDPIAVYRVVLPWRALEVATSRSGKTRLAVLPFANISPDPGDAYFADGLTEELITVLSQLGDLRVIARTSVGQYKATSKSVAQIGEELGVDAVLEGSVRKAGDQLRITVQLIDVASQTHTWANTFDRTLDNVFAIQAEIAKRVANQLKIDLAAPEASRLETRPPVKPDSYLAYLKGRTLLQVRAKDSFEAARRQFELAISLDPSNAGAHSGLSDVIRLTGWFFPDVPRETWHKAAQASALRAIELDPNLADAHASLAISLWNAWEWTAAQREFERALSLNPSYASAHLWYSAMLEDLGRGEDALRECRLCEEADPLWVESPGRLAMLLIWLGKLDEAFAMIQKVGELEPGGVTYHALLASYYLARSDLATALKEMEEIERLPQRPTWTTLHRALYAALQNDRAKVRELVREFETQPMFAAGIAYLIGIYAELGDLDDCYRWIEKGLEGRILPFQGIRLNPRLAAIRSDGRFEAILRRMNLS